MQLKTGHIGEPMATSKTGRRQYMHIAIADEDEDDD
jgi:hypothetical protein